MVRHPLAVLEISWNAGESAPAFVPSFRKSPPDRRDPASRERLLQRVRAEFLDMPGLLLTLPQAQRLFNLREDICVRVLATLEAEGLICQGPGRRYANRSVAAVL